MRVLRQLSQPIAARKVKGSCFEKGLTGLEKKVSRGGRCHYRFLIQRQNCAVFIDKQPESPGVPPFQQQQQFLALTVGRHHVHFPHIPQLLANQRNIGHGRELQQHPRCGGDQLRKQLQHIRLAVLQAEHLAAVRSPPGRIQEDDIGDKTVQDFPETAGTKLGTGHANVRETQRLEVGRCRRGKLGPHLIVQHGRCHLRERPAVHAQAAREVRHRFLPRQGPERHRRLVARGFGR